MHTQGWPAVRASFLWMSIRKWNPLPALLPKSSMPLHCYLRDCTSWTIRFLEHPKKALLMWSIWSLTILMLFPLSLEVFKLWIDRWSSLLSTYRILCWIRHDHSLSEHSLELSFVQIQYDLHRLLHWTWASWGTCLQHHHWILVRADVLSQWRSHSLYIDSLQLLWFPTMYLWDWIWLYLSVLCLMNF